MLDMLTVARAALADAARKWNNRSSPVIRRMPNELLLESCRLLDSRNLSRVAVVSRHFRSFSLSTPLFWSHISMRVNSEDRFGKLVELVDGTAPCRLNLEISRPKDVRDDQSVNERLSHLLDSVLERICALTIHSAFFSPPPVERTLRNLEYLELEYDDGNEHIILPEHVWAPRLRSLHLATTFTLPTTGCSLRHITSFSGRLLHERRSNPVSDASRLFELCPCLVSLALIAVHHESALPAGTPPPTLKEMKLVLGRDCRAWVFLSNMLEHGVHLQKLTLDGSYVLSRALKLLRSFHSGPWTWSTLR